MDVRAFGSWTSAQDFEGFTEVFAPGNLQGYPRGRPPDIRPQNLLFGLHFCSWNEAPQVKKPRPSASIYPTQTLRMVQWDPNPIAWGTVWPSHRCNRWLWIRGHTGEGKKGMFPQERLRETLSPPSPRELSRGNVPGPTRKRLRGNVPTPHPPGTFSQKRFVPVGTFQSHPPKSIPFPWERSHPKSSFKAHKMSSLGNRRNTVSRVLFRKRELNGFCGKWLLGELCEKNSVSSLCCTNKRLRGTHWVLSPEPGEDQKAHWARCLKPCSPKPYSARCFLKRYFHQISILERPRPQILIVKESLIWELCLNWQWQNSWEVPVRDFQTAEPGFK